MSSNITMLGGNSRMSVYLYDEAIVNKLRYWMQDPKISITDPSQLLSFRSDVDEEDKVKLHLVSLTRIGYSLKSKGKTPMSRDGWKYEANEQALAQLRAIPIRIKYQIDFISRKRKQNDELVREFIYKLTNNSVMEITIPYNDSQNTHKFSVDIEPDVDDNSDIEQHLEKGEKFRTTLNLVVENAYLFAYTIRDTQDVVVETSLIE